MSENNGVLVAMSGGVDSSVAACLLRDRGYRCVGATMRLFLNGDIGLSPKHPCCTQKDAADAAAAAERLGIPHEVLSREVDFKIQVIDPFIEAYEAGRTPNPCIDCNRRLKFEGLLEAARDRGLNFLATGHYARIEREPGGRWLLKKGLDPARDQSYVLYAMTQEQLAHTLFPLGTMTKAAVRELAAERGLANAKKHDSQDICFVPDGDYAAFIERYTGRSYEPGNFVDASGRTLGRHRGLIRYTIGQRRGLNIPAEGRLYVAAMDRITNTVTLTLDEKDLLFRAVTVEDVNLISLPALRGPIRAAVKIRYRQKEAPATVRPAPNGGALVEFDEPQRAPAPGQAAVFYDGDTVIGGGTISSAIRV